MTWLRPENPGQELDTSWRLIRCACFSPLQGRLSAKQAQAVGGLAETRSVCGWDRQTLRDWVHRYNADGLPGLGDRHGGGAPSRLSPEQEAEVGGWIRRGPDVEADGIVR